MEALEASGAARSSQRQPWNQSRTLRKSQRQPRSSQEQPADSQEPPVAARSSQEHPEPPGLGLESQGDPSQEATLAELGVYALGIFYFYYVVEERESAAVGARSCVGGRA